MNRNTESRFAELPHVNIARSIFDHSAGHKTTCNVGQLIPFYLEEVIPGSTFQITTSIVARLQTLLTPIMDNMYVDTYFFFEEMLDLWDHTKNFFGESASAWTPNVNYTIPQIVSPANGWEVGTIADYLGIPPKVGGLSVNALPFRMYVDVVNNWFRDQNLEDEFVVNKGDATITGKNANPTTADLQFGGYPFIAAKYHDQFTSALPSPSKGADTSIFSLMTDTMAPVVAGSRHSLTPQDVTWNAHNDAQSVDYNSVRLGFPAGATPASANAFFSNDSGIENYRIMGPNNLYADVSGVQFTINDLRMAYAMQKFYERSARSGSRYRETLLAHFGTTAPDTSLHIPEYLGGHRFPLSIHQVTNTSQGENAFLGDLGAMSNTADVHDDFIKSFSTHGYIMGFLVVRYDHTYSQGIEELWTRKDMFDFYWPELSNIGETPLKNKLIYATGSEPGDEGTFGYQEAWSSYRYKQNRCSGRMRPGVPQSLAVWHLGDYYTQTPQLSAEWIKEEKSNVDRVLAVTSAVSEQVLLDIYVKNKATLPMPVFSIPGLKDRM